MSRVRGACQHFLAKGGLCLGMAIWTTLLPAAESEKQCRQRHTNRSAHFLLHTDLPQGEASKLLERMEETLSEVSDYWRRPARGLIECYVVDDLKNWPNNSLPHPMARLVVDRIGGVTLVNEFGAGIQTRNKVIILAAARHGVAEHEVVHAYCGAVFGVTGPAWYREGIAQVFAYAQGEEPGLRCPPELIPDLTSEHPRALHEVVKESAFSQQLTNSLASKLNRRENLVGLIPISDWDESDVRVLDDLKGKYAWSWLACHLLHNNPNYKTRFKSLGQAYLADRRETFGELFAVDMRQLSFEYDFTVKHFAPGYRVDLCHWEWNKRFKKSTGGRSVRTRVAAARGYQASGLHVSHGEAYHVVTHGTWATDSQPATDAAGNHQGQGRLEGIVLKDFQLSEPFDIGTEDKFKAPCDGQLFLRCRDDWAQLSDNTGSVVVAIRRARSQR